MYQYQNYIDGRDVAAADRKTFTALNPTTGGPWGRLRSRARRTWIAR